MSLRIIIYRFEIPPQRKIQPEIWLCKSEFYSNIYNKINTFGITIFWGIIHDNIKRGVLTALRAVKI